MSEFEPLQLKRGGVSNRAPHAKEIEAIFGKYLNAERMDYFTYESSRPIIDLAAGKIAAYFGAMPDYYSPYIGTVAAFKNIVIAAKAEAESGGKEFVVYFAEKVTYDRMVKVCDTLNIPTKFAKKSKKKSENELSLLYSVPIGANPLGTSLTLKAAKKLRNNFDVLIGDFAYWFLKKPDPELLDVFDFSCIPFSKIFGSKTPGYVFYKKSLISERYNELLANETLTFAGTAARYFFLSDLFDKDKREKLDSIIDSAQKYFLQRKELLYSLAAVNDRKCYPEKVQDNDGFFVLVEVTESELKKFSDFKIAIGTVRFKKKVWIRVSTSIHFTKDIDELFYRLGEMKEK